MATLPVTFTFTVTVIFFLFVSSHARPPLDLTQIDVNNRNPLNTLPESDTKEEATATILLPSEKPETESATVFFQWESDTADAKPIESDAKSDESLAVEMVSESDTNAVDEEATLDRPLEVVSFRPVNRHFHHMHMNGRRPFRLPHRCRQHMKQVGPRIHPRDIPFGDDMIVPGEGGASFDPAVFRGGPRQIPARWVRFHHGHGLGHGGPRFPFRHHDDVFANEDGKRPHRHVEHEERGEVGLMKRFRKFLNHF